MEYQVVGLEIRDKLFIIRNLSFSNPDLLKLTQVLKELFCVLVKLRVRKLPLPVTMGTDLTVRHWSARVRGHQGNLLVVEAIHGNPPLPRLTH